MAVSKTYMILDRIIADEIRKGRKIAVFPMGRIGTLARYILENKYAYEGIYIDNKRCSDDFTIISFEKYRELDGSDVSIILATNIITLNKMLSKSLTQAELQAEIVNIIDGYDNGMEERLGKIRNLCRVKKAKECGMIRIGAEHDGGYVMLDDFSDKNVAYSIGIASETSWDLAMARKGFQVYCFDHTIQSLPEEHENLHFIRLGLGGMTRMGEDLHTLGTMLDLNNHTRKNKMILKIDIEGAEWDFLQEVSSEMLNQFSQITMELHHLSDPDYYEKIISGLKKINETHQAVWIHGNCIGGIWKYASVCMPELLEVTFANKEEYTFLPTDYQCPTELDYPNIGKTDICLDGWGSMEKR